MAGTVAIAGALVLGAPQHGLAKGAKGAAKSQSVTGCLAKGGEPNTWMLNETGAKGKRSVEIVETAPGVDLAAHVGHKVTITGTNLSTKAAATAEHTTASKEAGERHMRADALKMISTSCS
ncbi:MAG: hypothetical protein DMF87_09830 [Acidobacteria bacterium]|nr:MAG: hypothetical protein DMF87_09830 [Acidobacteriota bacterium]